MLDAALARMVRKAYAATPMLASVRSQKAAVAHAGCTVIYRHLGARRGAPEPPPPDGNPVVYSYFSWRSGLDQTSV